MKVQNVDYPDTKHLTEPVHDFLHKFDKNCMTDHTTTFEPVFCSECKHLASIHHEFHGGFYRCLNPNNTKTNQNWLHKWFSLIKHPKKINKHNNCPNFEKIEAEMDSDNTKIKVSSKSTGEPVHVRFAEGKKK